MQEGGEGVKERTTHRHTDRQEGQRGREAETNANRQIKRY